MFEPEPLPKTHLCQVDCCVCGAVTLAVPHHADKARCSQCWRDRADELADEHTPQHE